MSPSPISLLAFLIFSIFEATYYLVYILYNPSVERIKYWSWGQMEMVLISGSDIKNSL